MKLKRIYIDQFGKHNGLQVNLEENFNLLIGANESGKSTLLTFILSVFYGFNNYVQKRVEQNERMRYTPWSGSRFGGYITFEQQGTTYRLERSFGDTKSKDLRKLTDEASGKEVRIPRSVEPGEHLFGLKREEFLNTVFIGQLSTTIEKDENIRQKLMALSGGQAMDTSIHKIKDALAKERRVLSPPKAQGLLQEAELQLKSLEEEQRTAREVADQAKLKRKSLVHAQAELEALEAELGVLQAEEKVRDMELAKEEVQAIKDLDVEISRLLHSLAYESIEDMLEHDDIGKGEAFLERWEELANESSSLEERIGDLQEREKQLPNREVLSNQLNGLKSFASERRNYIKYLASYAQNAQEEARQFQEETNRLEQVFQEKSFDLERRTQRNKEEENAFHEKKSALEAKRAQDQAADDALVREAKDKLTKQEEDYSRVIEARTIAESEVEKKKAEIASLRERHDSLIETLHTLETSRVKNKEALRALDTEMDGLQEAHASQLADLEAEAFQEKQGLRNIENTEVKKYPMQILFYLAVLLGVVGIIYVIGGSGHLGIVLPLFGGALLLFIIAYFDKSRRDRSMQGPADILQRFTALEEQYQEQRNELIRNFGTRSEAIEKQGEALENVLSNLQMDITREKTNVEHQANRILEAEETYSALGLKLETLQDEVREQKSKLQNAQAYQENLKRIVNAEYLERYDENLESLISDHEKQKEESSKEFREAEDALAEVKKALNERTYVPSSSLVEAKNRIDQDRENLLEVLDTLSLSEELESDALEEALARHISERERQLHNLEQIAVDRKAYIEALQEKRHVLESHRVGVQDAFLERLAQEESLELAVLSYKDRAQDIREVKNFLGRKEERLKVLKNQDLSSVERKVQEQEEELEVLQTLRTNTSMAYDVDTLRSRIHTLRNQINQHMTTIGNVQGELKNIYSQTRMLQEIEEDLALAHKRWEILGEEVKDYDLAIQMIDAIDEELQKSFGPLINERTAEILQAITGEDDQSVLIDSEFKVKIEDIDSKMLKESAYFSAGKVDQIYLALRLAIALTLYSGADGEILPFIFDDSLVQYDPARTERTLAYLKNISEEEGRQMLFTTCHPSYEELMDFAYVISLE